MLVEPLRLLLGTNSLSHRVKRQNQLLNEDRRRVAAQAQVLRQSFVHTLVSPVGLAAALATGFAFTRIKSRPPAPKPAEPKVKVVEQTVRKQHSWLWELLFPIGFAWAREFVMTRLHSTAEPAQPSAPPPSAGPMTSAQRAPRRKPPTADRA